MALVLTLIKKECRPELIVRIQFQNHLKLILYLFQKKLQQLTFTKKNHKKAFTNTILQYEKERHTLYLFFNVPSFYSILAN